MQRFLVIVGFFPPLSDGNSLDRGKENSPPMMTPTPTKRRCLAPLEGCEVEIREASAPILHFSLKELEVHSLWPCTYLTVVNNLTKGFYLSVLGFHWIQWLFLAQYYTRPFDYKCSQTHKARFYVLSIFRFIYLLWLQFRVWLSNLQLLVQCQVFCSIQYTQTAVL